MKKYFFADGKEKHGPFSLEELKNEEITPDTLIWFEGLEDWTPIKEIEELKEILHFSPPPIPEISESEDKKQNNVDFQNTNLYEFEIVGTVYPWRRFFARTLDVLTSGFILLLIFSFAIGRLFPNSVEDYVKIVENPIAAGILLYVLWIPMEALFLYSVGTTPAKWLYGIYVKNKSIESLSFNKAISRAFQVFVYGEGFAIPIITAFTRYFAFRKLINTGRTTWDNNIGSMIIYEKWSTIKKIVSIILTTLVLIIFAYINTQT